MSKPLQAAIVAARRVESSRIRGNPPVDCFPQLRDRRTGRHEIFSTFDASMTASSHERFAYPLVSMLSCFRSSAKNGNSSSRTSVTRCALTRATAYSIVPQKHRTIYCRQVAALCDCNESDTAVLTTLHCKQFRTGYAVVRHPQEPDDAHRPMHLRTSNSAL